MLSAEDGIYPPLTNIIVLTIEDELHRGLTYIILLTVEDEPSVVKQVCSDCVTLQVKNSFTRGSRSPCANPPPLEVQHVMIAWHHM